MQTSITHSIHPGIHRLADGGRHDLFVPIGGGRITEAEGGQRRKSPPSLKLRRDIRHSTGTEAESRRSLGGGGWRAENDRDDHYVYAIALPAR